MMRLFTGRRQARPQPVEAIDATVRCPWRKKMLRAMTTSDFFG
jgi:hypothetical protein